MYYSVKNWSSFQHYKDRNPPWVKLHKSLLDDYSFQTLPVASRALAPMLWLLASEHKDPSSGVIDGDDQKLSFRLRMLIGEFKEAINPLIRAGFIFCLDDASDALADGYTSATPETEVETEVETEAEVSKHEKTKRSSAIQDDWKPNERHIEKSKQNRIDCEREAEKFRNYHKSKGNKFKDWDAAFNNWLIKAAEYSNGNTKQKARQVL